MKDRIKINWFIVIGIIIIIGLLYFYYNPRIVSTESEDFLAFRLYDKQHNLIGSYGSNTLSIVNGIPKVWYIDFIITLRNTGLNNLNCQIVGATPVELLRAISDDIKPLPFTGTKKIYWVSEQLLTSLFETETDSSTFTVTARCSYIDKGEEVFLPEKTGTISIYIRPDETVADFVVDLGYSAKEYCGDRICKVPYENWVKCPADCSF